MPLPAVTTVATLIDIALEVLSKIRAYARGEASPGDVRKGLETALARFDEVNAKIDARIDEFERNREP